MDIRTGKMACNNKGRDQAHSSEAEEYQRLPSITRSKGRGTKQVLLHRLLKRLSL